MHGRPRASARKIKSLARRSARCDSRLPATAAGSGLPRRSPSVIHQLARAGTRIWSGRGRQMAHREALGHGLASRSRDCGPTGGGAGAYLRGRRRRLSHLTRNAKKRRPEPKRTSSWLILGKREKSTSGTCGSLKDREGEGDSAVRFWGAALSVR